jgi:hypothetical protein
MYVDGRTLRIKALEGQTVIRMIVYIHHIKPY